MSSRFDLASSIADALPGIARPPSERETNRQKGARYARFYASFDGLGLATSPANVRDFSFPGDHIFCTQKAGEMAIGIRFGVDGSNPYLPLRQGALYKGSFTKFRIRAFNARRSLFLTSSYAEIELFASDGPLIGHWPEHAHGFSAPKFHRDTKMNGAGPMVASTVPYHIPEPDVSGTDRIWSTVGRFGGTLVVQNEDMANELLIGFEHNVGSPLTIAECEIIYPGQRREYELDGTVGRGQFPVQTGKGNRSWVVMTAAGTCKFSYAVSSGETSMLDPNNVGFTGEAPW